MAKNSPKRDRKQDKWLITGNFSLSHSVFKRLVLQSHEKNRAVWERVKTGIFVFLHNSSKGFLSGW